MRNPRERLLAIAFVTIWTGLSAGCVDSDTRPSGSGGTDVSTSSGPGGTGGEAGQGGDAGTGGESGQGGSGAAPFHGLGATEWVGAGGVVRGGGLTMIFTLGQPTTNTGKSMSSSYRLQGGLVGAHGSEP